MRRLVAVLAFIVLTTGAVSSDAMANHGSAVGTRSWTFTQATAANGSKGTYVSNYLRQGYASRPARSDYVRAASIAIGADWRYRSVSNCGDDACTVNFVLYGKAAVGEPITFTSVFVNRTRLTLPDNPF